MNLRAKSLSELRGIAQAFQVSDIFEKDAAHLIQEIEIKQNKMAAKEPLPVINPYDVRLMKAVPSNKCNLEELTEVLAEHIKRGLKLRLDDERWYMQFGRKTDEGTLRMPLRTALQCAERLMA